MSAAQFLGKGAVDQVPWWLPLIVLMQSLLMAAGGGLLWSIRKGFHAGSWSTGLEARLTSVEQSLSHARDKQSELGDEFTTKMFEIHQALSELKAEFRVAWNASLADHQRYDRELEHMRHQIANRP